jgi:hypothetical protein
VNFNEEIFSKYNFFIEKNKKIIEKITDENNSFYSDFNDCFFILEHIYDILIQKGSFYDIEHLNAFEYCFEYIVGIVDVLEHLGEKVVFDEKNKIFIYELINLYNYNYVVLEQSNRDLADRSNTILVNYIALLEKGEVDNKVLHGIETFILEVILPKVSEENLPAEVFANIVSTLKK